MAKKNTPDGLDQFNSVLNGVVPGGDKEIFIDPEDLNSALHGDDDDDDDSLIPADDDRSQGGKNKKLDKNQIQSKKAAVDEDEDDEEVEKKPKKRSQKKEKVKTLDVDDFKKEMGMESKSSDELKIPGKNQVGNGGVDDESNIVDPFLDLFSEELGWELDDEDRPKDIKGLVSYMNAIIEENSRPNYASEEVEELDEFLRNGGSMKAYFDTRYGEIDYDNFKLKTDDDKRRVVRDFYREQYQSKGEDWIERKIDKLDDAGLLDDEADEALETLREKKKEKTSKLVQQQQRYVHEQRENEKKFFEDTSKGIFELDEIRGVKLDKKEKQKLVEYIFKPQKDGETQYQKDYLKNKMNLIESAFFTMNADKFVNEIKKSGSKSAVDRIKERFKESVRTKNQVGEERDNGSIWDSVYKQINK